MKPAAASCTSERGFVLPGVVMFVIVLTILGLSLFALSSYEAQFMNATLDETQAFYLANGAIDRAKYLLTSTYQLGNVSANLGAGVDSAVAIQDPYGTPILSGDWRSSDDPILIRVVAQKNGYRRKLEALFDPHIVRQYDMLFTLSSPSRGLVDEVPADDNNDRVGFDGRLWQTYDGSAPLWSEDIYDCYNSFSTMLLNTDLVGFPVPPPQVTTFLSNYPQASSPPMLQGDYQLDAIKNSPQLDSVAFFRSTSGGGANYSLDIKSGPTTFEVSGIAIWAFDNGLAVENHKLTVHGASSKDMLVMVSHQSSTSAPPYGFWFEGGIESNIPVILVSDQMVSIGSEPNGNLSTTIPWFCCYASTARIHGPSAGNLFLYYHPASDPDAEHNLDKLFEKRALPNVTGPRNGLAYKPGTWRELPTN